MLRFISRFVRKNTTLKLFSLALAAMLWLTIASETNSVINRTVPLAFTGFPPNMEISGESAMEVNLQLRGSSSLLNEISPADVTAVISLSGYEAGAHSVNLTSGSIQAPFGVEVLRIDPPRVDFQLERTLTRTIRVSPTMVGNVASGFVIGEVRVDPPTAQVLGPETHVAPIESLPTLPIDIEGVRASVRKSVDLDITDPMVRLASITSYDVLVEIREAHDETSFRAAPSAELGEQGWEVDPSEIQVRIGGPRNLISAIDPSGLSFTVDLTGLEPGTHSVAPQITNLAEGIYITAILPETVTIRSREP